VIGMDPLDLTPVAELRELLTTAGIRNAEDPAQLTPPGVLVKVETFTQDTLAGLQLTTRLFCIVPDQDHERASAELVALVNTVLTVVDPDGPVAAASVVLPGDAARLPAMTIPLNLYTS
jgi:hypothetical protein